MEIMISNKLNKRITNALNLTHGKTHRIILHKITPTLWKVCSQTFDCKNTLKTIIIEGLNSSLMNIFLTASEDAFADELVRIYK